MMFKLLFINYNFIFKRVKDMITLIIVQNLRIEGVEAGKKIGITEVPMLESAATSGRLGFNNYFQNLGR